MKAMALQIKQLNKTYSNGTLALNNLNLDIESGDFYALLGPNGAGKSTTIGIISSLVNKSSGQVIISNHDIDIAPQSAKLSLGTMPQEINLSIFETPLQILVNQATYFGIKRKQAILRAHDLLEQMELVHKKNTPVRMLSGGMKRRLMVARALMHSPKLLLLDEPTAGVDIAIRQKMWEIISQLNQEGMTILLSTHYFEEAERLCNKVAIINHGEIILKDSMNHVLSRPQTQQVHIHTAQKFPVDFKLDQFAFETLDDTVIKVTLDKDQNLNHLFERLNAQQIQVVSVQNNTSHLEQLFINLTGSNKEVQP